MRKRQEANVTLCSSICSLKSQQLGDDFFKKQFLLIFELMLHLN